MNSNLEKLQKNLEKLHFFGKCQIEVSKGDEYSAYLLKIIDHEVYDIYNAKGEMIKENEESSCLKYKMFVDLDGKISIIEHGYGIFTEVNANEVAFIIQFIGIQLDLNELEGECA